VSDPIQDAVLAIIPEKKKVVKPAKEGEQKIDDAVARGVVIDIMSELNASFVDERKSDQNARC
tara:strand:- start:5260 stop:5448 length:189 start_codon:yes stop_codon:yes gene_type:complete